MIERSVRPAFVGRRDELDFLSDSFDRAREGRPQLIAIEGDAGIGKSRLIDEFVASNAGAIIVARGCCSEQVRTPYLPFLSVLSTLDRRAAERAFDPPRDGDAAKGKAAFFAASAAIVRRAARTKPVVTIVEDVQWADSASLELLSYLLHGLDDARALTLVSLRSEDAAANAGLAAFRLHAARHRCTPIRLRGLSRNELRCLVSGRLSGRFANAGILGDIERLSEGNPLFAEELSQIASDGRLNLAADSPISLDAMLSERFAPLSERDRFVLIRTAIVGRTFDARFVARIAGRSYRDTLETLQRAVDAHLVIPDPDFPERFRFRHELIRQALADRLVVGLAAPLHARIADELERNDSENVAALAYHWSAARVADKAREYNERAAQAAWRVFAYRDAVGFYVNTLGWEYPPGVARARAFERLGTLLYVEGCGDEPASWFERARDEWDAFEQPVAAARAWLRMADQYWVDARTRECIAASQSAVDRLATLGDRDGSFEARTTLARFAITLGDAARADRELRYLEPLICAAGCATAAGFFEVRAEVGAASGRTAVALADCATASRLARESRSSEAIVQIENNCALVAAELGDVEQAIRRHESALSEARRTSMQWRIAYSALNFAQTLTIAGDLRRALALAWEAVESGVTTATFRTKAAAVGIPLALAMNDRRLLDACAREESLQIARRSGEPQRIAAVSAAFAELRAAQGAMAESRAIVDDAIETIGTPHRCTPLILHVIAHGTERERRWAAEILRRDWTRPLVRRGLRLLLHAASQTESQPRRPRAAAAAMTFERLGWKLVRARCLELAGDVSAASLAYEAMGDVRHAERLRGAAPDESKREALSPRQTQIARLVAGGATNRTIAAQLQISEHTVEHHVSNIFVRLGLRSRSALAARIGSGAAG